MSVNLRERISKMWEEHLHPRDMVGRFRFKGPLDFTRGIRSDGRISLLSQGELDESDIDTQISILRQIQAQASVGGDYRTATQAAQEIMSLHGRARSLSKAKVVDGDGDGKVFDGTPRERPATPAEAARGRKLRAQRRSGRGGATSGRSVERWVIRGRDDDGNLLVETATSREEAVEIGEQWQKKRFKGVKATRLKDGEKLPEPKRPEAQEEKKPDTEQKRPENVDENGEVTTAKPKPSVDLKNDRAKKIYDLVDWDTHDIPEEDRVVAAHYVTAFDAALRDNKDQFDELMQQTFQDLDSHSNPDALLDKVDSIIEELIDEESMGVMNDKLDEWGAHDVNSMWNNWQKSGDMYFDGENAEYAKTTPAFKHLVDGGSITDAPNEGLIESIRALPERFKMRTNINASINENWWIDDQETGDRWMAKGAPQVEGFDATPNDHFNEILAYMALKDTGIETPETRWATSPDAEQTWILQRDIGQQVTGEAGVAHASDAVLNSDLYMEAVESGDLTRKNIKKIIGDGAKGMADPADMLRILLADYVMGGSDRHAGNFMWLDGKNGFSYVLVDNGGTFGTYSTPDTNFGQWITGAGNVIPKLNAAIARELVGTNNLQDEISKFSKELSRINIKQLQDSIKRADLTPEQRKLAVKHIKAMQKRLEDLSDVETIAQEIAEI